MLYQFPAGDTAFNNTLTLQPGQLSIDTQAGTIRVHDGVTQGGHVRPAPQGN